MSTVAVSEPVHRRLVSLKGEWGLSSLDEVIGKLMDDAKPVPKSMMGIDKRLPKFTRKLRDRIWDEKEL